MRTASSGTGVAARGSSVRRSQRRAEPTLSATGGRSPPEFKGEREVPTPFEPLGGPGGGAAAAPPRIQMKILQVVSCRGWSSDAYWATRMCSELDGSGPEAILVCGGGTGERVISSARAEGVKRLG